MAPQKKNLMEHYEDGNLDLSLCSLQEVPVKDIAAIPKAISLDLSCNTIGSLPKSFASSLTRLVKLDLSKNQLTALPDNFGLLVNLKHLDLDNNKLESLPLSFGNLKSLRWLDLKQNPLMPKLAQIAGLCLDAKQCQAAAKNVVAALRAMEEQVEAERTRRKEKQLKKQEAAEELIKIQNKENAQPKKKKKKLANILYNSNNFEQTNGQTIMGEQGEFASDIINKNTKGKTALTKKSPENKGLLRRVGGFLSTLFKIFVMSALLVTFCMFLLSLFNEDMYVAVKKRANDIIQTNVPKSYLKQWDRGVSTTRKVVVKWSDQVIAISVHWYNKAHDYFSALSNSEVVQQYLESLKSGWHILWIQISEVGYRLSQYFSAQGSSVSDSPSDKL